MKKEITVLKEARKRLKLTQTDIAKELGVSRMTITYYETNVMSPVAKDMYKIAGAYKLTDLEVAQWIKEISEE